MTMHFSCHLFGYSTFLFYLSCQHYLRTLANPFNFMQWLSAGAALVTFYSQNSSNATNLFNWEQLYVFFEIFVIARYGPHPHPCPSSCFSLTVPISIPAPHLDSPCPSPSPSLPLILTLLVRPHPHLCPSSWLFLSDISHHFQYFIFLSHCR